MSVRLLLPPAVMPLPCPAAAQDRDTQPLHRPRRSAAGMEFLHKASFGAAADARPGALSAISTTPLSCWKPQAVSSWSPITPGYLGIGDVVPDVVTMNHAHGTHWTADPDPRIPHVLQGWGPNGAAG